MVKAKRARFTKKQLWGYFFVGPTFIGVLILNIWSIIQTIYLSFTETKGFLPSKFIGLENYTRMIGDTEIFRALGNTFFYALLTVPLGILLSLMVAVLLNTRIRGKSFYRVLYFLPVISAPVAVSLVWKWLYNREYGLLNHILVSLGGTGLDWLGDRSLALPSIAVVGIWSMLGYNMVILLAGLQEIPETLYEAAEIDGAGPMRKFFKITVPMVSPTLFFVTVTTTISALQMFDFTYMMMEKTGPAFKNAQTLVYLFYRYTFENYNKGYGSTVVVLLLVIILALTALQMLLQKKWVHYD